MVKTIPEKVEDDILVYLNKCNCIKVYFDEEGLKTWIDTMACKKQQCTYKTCQSLITDKIDYYYPNKPKFCHLFFLE